MNDILNSRIKPCERFSAFAPRVLEERAGERFEDGGRLPFMLMTCQVRKDKHGLVPAIRHLDGTARQQTVRSATNPNHWGLIRAFEKRTAVPIVGNVWFNENEPVV